MFAPSSYHSPVAKAHHHHGIYTTDQRRQRTIEARSLLTIGNEVEREEELRLFIQEEQQILNELNPPALRSFALEVAQRALNHIEHSHQQNIIAPPFDFHVESLTNPGTPFVTPPNSPRFFNAPNNNQNQNIAQVAPETVTNSF